MKKRFLILCLLLAGLALVALPQTGAAQVKDFYWESVDVDISLMENGDMRVVEQQTLVFSGGTFSFGFRTIPIAGTDGIDDISVREGDIVYTQSGSNGPHTFEVGRSGGDLRVDWYFPPAQGRRTYIFSYIVRGAVRVATEADGGDQIFWKAIPADHPARIENSSVTIRLPDGMRPQVLTGTNDPLVAAYIDGRESDAVAISVSEDGSRITYDVNQSLLTGEQMEVRVQFPSTLPIETPSWQRDEQVGDTLSLLAIVAGALLLIGGPTAVLLLWYTRGRDPEVGIAADYIPEPPDGLPPAVVGTLVDEKADLQDVIATLLDLARRGYLTMEEKKSDHLFTRTDKPDDGLRPFEQRFVKALFGRKESRSLNSLKYKFADKLGGIQSALYEEIVTEGLFKRSPNSVRTGYRVLGFVLLGLAILLFVVIPNLFGLGAAAVCPPLALAITAVMLIIVGGYMPAKTRKGSEAAANWRAFKQYLKEIESYTNLEEATDVFEKYLPYAVAFGLERTWIRKFATVPMTPIPPWYMPYGYGPGWGRGGTGGRGKATGTGSGSGGPAQMPTLEGMSGGLTGGLEGMSGGLTRMLTSTSSVMRSVRPSSSSSGSSFGGGFSSGGFSGGGSSGGGSMGFG